jgi:hypothetical protein
VWQTASSKSILFVMAVASLEASWLDFFDAVFADFRTRLRETCVARTTIDRWIADRVPERGVVASITKNRFPSPDVKMRQVIEIRTCVDHSCRLLANQRNVARRSLDAIESLDVADIEIDKDDFHLLQINNDRQRVSAGSGQVKFVLDGRQEYPFLAFH